LGSVKQTLLLRDTQSGKLLEEVVLGKADKGQDLKWRSKSGRKVVKPSLENEVFRCGLRLVSAMQSVTLF